MLKLSRSFLSVLFCIISVGSAFSSLQNEKGQLIIPKRQGGKIDELQRRQEIAEEYMSSLDKIKESWIDPYQMINCQTRECMGLLNKKDIFTTSTVYKETSSEATIVTTSSDAETENKPLQSDDTVDHKVITNEHHVIADEIQSSAQSNIYFSRWVKKLLLLIEKENIDESSMISFSLNGEILNQLKEMSHDKMLEVSQMDEVFTSVLSDAIIYKKKIYEWTDMIDYTKYFVWMITAGSVIVFMLYLFYTSSINHPYLTLLFLFLSLAVFWHWMHLFQQRVAFKQAELSSMSIPKECKKHDFGFFEGIQEYLKSFFKSDGCAKYYEALLVDPVWEVSITVAMSEAFASFLLQPLSTGSHILNKSLKHLFDELTLEVKLFLIVFLLMMLIMKCNYRIKLPYFMGVIEPCHPPLGSSIQNVPATKSLTESSKETIIKVLNYVQGEDKVLIKHDSLSYSTNEIIENIQSSEPIQSILGPSEIHPCACISEERSAEKIESVIEGEKETSAHGIVPNPTSDNYLNQSDDSLKISNVFCECKNLEAKLCIW